MDNDLEMFKGMKFSNLLEEIVDNSRSKRSQIDILISDLRLFIKGPGEALTIVPLIRDYIDVGVKNDDQLVKLAAIVQRVMSTKVVTDTDATGLGLTDEEKKQLQEEIDKMKDDDSDFESLKKKTETVLSDLDKPSEK